MLCQTLHSVFLDRLSMRHYESIGPLNFHPLCAWHSVAVSLECGPRIGFDAIICVYVTINGEKYFVYLH